LNPLGHLDPIGSIMLLFAGFGWGKPVEVNPRNYDRRFSMDKANAIVSIAGPIMNFILAIIFTIIFFIVLKVNNINILFLDSMSAYSSNISTTMEVILGILVRIISINIGLGVFNLIPLPPLDGSKVIKPFLPFNAKQWFESNERIFELVFIALWIMGILSTVISPIIGFITNNIFKIGISLFRL
jgi:Zn-dependent protease